MDFRKVPSCTEVSLWSPEVLIDYFRRCNLKDCEKLVKKQGIDGKRFLDMSENDMQKFPKTTVPMLIRIQQEIIKREEKKGFFPLRSETQKGYPTGKLHVPYQPSSHDTCQSENWDGTDSDSFDDDDYEDPDEPEKNADYESPAPEDEDSENSDGYEPPPTNNDILPISAPKNSSSNQDYIDRPVPSDSVRYPPNPPTRTGVSTFTSHGNTFPGFQSSSQDGPKLPKSTKSLAPSVDRTTKPSIQANAGKVSSTSGKNLSSQAKAVTLPATIRPHGKPDPLRKPALPSQSSATKSSFPSHIPDSEDILLPEENVPRRLYTPHQSNTFPSRSPKPSIRNMGSNTLHTTDISQTAGPLQMPGGLSYSPYKPDNQFSDILPNGRQPVPNPIINNSTSGNEGIYSEQWYLGNISRKDAENALRSINKDGTFLVRNCSQSTTSQPYVLMVLYKNKVYNVRIRFHQKNQVYLLGSGGHETFDSVSEIIDYFRKTPLLLIDGKDRGSRQHCKLTYIPDRSFN
ncbi:lymphocyte cytosolic protein 2 isoform X1 [Bufo gargarizans]|uniref:lymphocyte cytosolic protein 2 isoform X1 n=2 Tax=Bufo gargarizans TaxID=30331 RepID=UPI001CF450A5|nr:lymphocyte cytosolic protein 2 isoform X1 [Bufo gargarizans]